MYSFKQSQVRNAKYIVELRKKATRQELIVKDYLDTQGIRAMFQKGFLKPFHRIVDFYIPKHRLIIEIDGGYHKDCVDKDLIKDMAWRRFKTIRITNEQVDDGRYTEMLKDYLLL